jgi:predicted transcriptional regulator
MKIKEQQIERKPLKELYQVGEVLKVKQTFFDGRGYEYTYLYVTITQVNKVTLYGTDKKGRGVILDLDDLIYAKKVIQQEILA